MDNQDVVELEQIAYMEQQKKIIEIIDRVSSLILRIMVFQSLQHKLFMHYLPCECYVMFTTLLFYVISQNN